MVVKYLSDIHTRTQLNYNCSFQSQMHISIHKLYLLGVTNSNCQICVTSKASGGKGWWGGCAGGWGLTQQPTTVAISMFSNLKHLAPTKNLASIQDGFKVAPKCSWHDNDSLGNKNYQFLTLSSMKIALMLALLFKILILAV